MSIDTNPTQPQEGEGASGPTLAERGGVLVQSTLRQVKNKTILQSYSDFPGGSDGKVSAYNVGDPGSTPGSGRSSGEGNGNLLWYSCLENPMDRGA